MTRRSTPAPPAPRAPPPPDFAAAARQLLSVGLLPIPAHKKHPAVSHKVIGSGPQWSRAHAQADLDDPSGAFARADDIGILCDVIVVLDFDHLDAEDGEGTRIMQLFYSLAPNEFAATVTAKTGHGRHVYFMRTPLCNQLDLYDGPLGVRKAVGGEAVRDAKGRAVQMPMDIKTLTRRSSKCKAADGSFYVYNTPGFLSVCPSLKKMWLTPPTSADDILPIPDDVVRKILELRGMAPKPDAKIGEPTAKVARTRPEPVQRPLAVKPRPGYMFEPNLDWDMDCLAAMGFNQSQVAKSYSIEKPNERMREAGYINGMYQFLYSGKPCPLCHSEWGHINCYWVAVKPDGNRYIRQFSENCALPGEVQHKCEIPWTSGGIAAYIDDMYKKGQPVAVDKLAVLGYPTFDGAKRAWMQRPGQLLVDMGDGWVIETRFAMGDLVRAWPVCRRSKKPWVASDGETWPCPIGPAKLLQLTH